MAIFAATMLIRHFIYRFQTVYSAVTFAGYVGILTGQKPYGFTISVDRRGKSYILIA